MKQFITLTLIGSALVIPLTSSAIMIKDPIACTMDARMCPDGSYVGRSGPNCEFKCPSETAKPAPIKKYPEIKRGETSDTIKDIQTILRAESSIYNGPMTGYFGPMTETAIKKLQAKFGLPVTGVIDSATREVLFPSNANTQLTLLSPNGGEVWKTGEKQTISWNIIEWGNQIPMPAPRPNEIPVMPTVPANDANKQNMMGGVSGSGEASEGGMGSALPMEISPMRMFFPRATITLLKDSDPSFAKPLGTVNLKEKTKVIKIPAGFPLASDYRIRISLGGQTPCLYRAEGGASGMEKTIDSNVSFPCPMDNVVPSTISTVGTTVTSSSGANWLNPASSTSDTSDGTFSIIAGTIIPNERDAEIKRKIIEIEAMIAKLMEELKRIKEMTGTTVQ